MSEPDGYTPQPLAERAADAVRRRGLRPVAGDFARYGAEAVAGLPWTLRGARGSFTLDERRYPYAHHRYNLSWLTERAVEVPVVQALVDANAGRRVLEVGNVLSHFRPQEHIIVDKYERASGVLNRDAAELADLGSFDLIVAISTLEHVGWDEVPRDPGKAIASVLALRRQLRPGGQMLITVPVGYNAFYDRALREGEVPVQRALALRRTAPGPHWHEVPVAAAWTVPYDFLIYSARAVVFAFIAAET